LGYFKDSKTYKVHYVLVLPILISMFLYSLYRFKRIINSLVLIPKFQYKNIFTAKLIRIECSVFIETNPLLQFPHSIILHSATCFSSNFIYKNILTPKLIRMFSFYRASTPPLDHLFKCNVLFLKFQI